MDPHQDHETPEEESSGDAQGSADTDDAGSEKTEHEEDADRADSAAGDDEEVEAEMKRIEENPPENLEDWPQGKAKYETFGGPEGTHGYHEGPEQKLGPSSLRHHEGGEVSVEGDTVDDPGEYKGDPIPGGPTDPASPDQPGERDLEQGRESEDSGDTESEDSDEAKDSSEG
ncbi:MAG: hypothetical protein H0W05_00355 [Thermoleophilaceae bacterium]|jgi:hypothetical protein|nr:hypothetical protein [Thermoleophilaceae bacterium]